jgi:ABC-2 type transport system permease protein
MSEWEGIYTIWFREALRYIRYRSRILSSIVTPLLWLLIFGTGLGSAIRFGGIAGSYKAFIFPGIIGQTILFTSIFSGVSVIMDRQYGFLKEIMVAPVSRPSIVFGKALGIGTASIIQGVILLLLSFVVGVQMTPVIFIASFLLMIPISVGLAGVGLLIATFTDSMEGFNLIMSFIVLPMFLLSGALFPVTGLPSFLQVAVYLDPLTYGVDALRQVIIGQGALPLYESTFVVVGFAVFTIVLAAILFSKKEQNLM